MVLRDSLQRRIGITFFIFSFAVCLIHIARALFSNAISDLFTLETISFLIYPFVFGISILKTNEILKFLQVLCVGIEGIITLVLSPTDSFFGLLLLFQAIVLSSVYGFLKNHKTLKGILISGVLLSLFSTFSLNEDPTPLLSSIMWVGFLWITLFILWVIFKDYVAEHENQIQLREEYLQESLKELKQKVEEYAEISHISLDTNKELLEIIKNYKAGGCDD